MSSDSDSESDKDSEEMRDMIDDPGALRSQKTMPVQTRKSLAVQQIWGFVNQKKNGEVDDQQVDNKLKIRMSRIVQNIQRLKDGEQES